VLFGDLMFKGSGFLPFRGDFDPAASRIQGVAFASYALYRIGIPVEQIKKQVAFHDDMDKVLRAAILADNDPTPIASEAYFEYVSGVRQNPQSISDLFPSFAIKVRREFKASGQFFTVSPDRLEDPTLTSVALGHLLVLQQDLVRERCEDERAKEAESKDRSVRRNGSGPLQSPEKEVASSTDKHASN